MSTLKKEKKEKKNKLRARRPLSLINNVPLRTRRGLLPYKVDGDSALLVLNGTLLNSLNALLALSRRSDPHSTPVQMRKACEWPMTIPVEGGVSNKMQSNTDLLSARIYYKLFENYVFFLHSCHSVIFISPVPAFRRKSRLPGTVWRGTYLLRPTVHTIIECPRLPGTITVEWFLLCAPALR